MYILVTLIKKPESITNMATCVPTYLKNTYYCRVWVVISEQCESLTELVPGICVNIQYILVKFNGRIIFRKNKMVGRH